MNSKQRRRALRKELPLLKTEYMRVRMLGQIQPFRHWEEAFYQYRNTARRLSFLRISRAAFKAELFR